MQSNVDASKRKKLYSEGVLKLGSCPCYQMKLFPIITMSMYLQEVARSQDSGEQRLVIELPACPGDHNIFRMVEDFCYGLVDCESKFISSAAKLVEVCDFLCLQTLSARVLMVLKEHVLKSWNHCLNTLATFQMTGKLQENKAFLVCQSSFLDYIAVKLECPEVEREERRPTMVCNVKRLYQVLDFSPEMADILLDALSNHCKKSFSNDVLVSSADMFDADSLKKEELYLHRLCNVTEYLDDTQIPKEIMGTFFDTLRRFRPSVFNLTMFERLEEQAAKEPKVQPDLAILRTRFKVQKTVLKTKQRELDMANHALRSSQDELRIQKENLEEEVRKSQCQICMENSRDTLCLPCSHFLYCSNCLSRHQRIRNTCPACRGPITGLLKCILSL